MRACVDFQSHTQFHTNLPTCGDDAARREIFESKRTLEQRFGLEIHTISYPNGDYSDRDIGLCREAGYSCGITLDYGYNTVHTDLMRLKRLSMNDTADVDELAIRASGVWGFFKSLAGIRQEYGYVPDTDR